MKIQISIDDRLLERVDKYADENYMSRSGFASLAMSQYLNQNDMLNLLK
jgi:metal-responsive CopG/Arc/MetJ family transcriptional regulator